MKVRQPKEYREKLEQYHPLPQKMGDDTMKEWFSRHDPIQKRHVARVLKLTWADAFPEEVGSNRHLDFINIINSISK